MYRRALLLSSAKISEEMTSYVPQNLNPMPIQDHENSSQIFEQDSQQFDGDSQLLNPTEGQTIECLEQFHEPQKQTMEASSEFSRISEDQEDCPSQSARIYPDCPVCLEEMQAPSVCPCGHMFCQNCISKWITRNQNCPMCRRAVKVVPNVSQQVDIIKTTLATTQQPLEINNNPLVSNYIPRAYRAPLTVERKHRWSRFWRKFRTKRRGTNGV